MKTATKLLVSMLFVLTTSFFLVQPGTIAQTIPLKPCLEHFTSSTCPPCATFGPKLRGILSNFEGNYTVIRYQMNWPGTGDPYYIAESKKRRDYYSVTGVPSLSHNGVKQLPYASDFSLAIMQGLMTKLTGVEIGIVSSVNADELVNVEITITPEVGYPAGLVAQVVVMEGVTTENATTNGEKGFENVVMAFLPNANGSVLSALVPGQPVKLNFTLDMKTTHRETLNDLVVAAFIQDNATKQIIQSNNVPVAHSFTDYTVSLEIVDNDYNVVPGGKAFIPIFGEKQFGSDGLATFSGVLPGAIHFEVSAPGYEKNEGDLTVVGENASQMVMLEKPDLFFYEDFGWNVIPEGWEVKTVGDFMLFGAGTEAGSVVFYKPSDGEDNSYLILPELNLNQSGIFSFKAGVQSGTPDLKVGIVTLGMAPGAEGTDGMTVTGFTELYSVQITRATSYLLYGFALPENIGNQRLAIKYVGPGGSYCEVDQVAVLEDNPGVKVQFLVTDADDVPLKNTTVTLNDKTVTNNSYGYATFRDTDTGSHSYTINYNGLDIETGNITVDDALIKVVKYNTSGVETVHPDKVVSIYPNPVKESLTVTGVERGILSVLSMNGQQLIRMRVQDGESISVKDLSNGLYLIKIEADQKIYFRKILIAR
jgi:hypothetical protein